MHDPRFSNTLELAVRFGKTLIIQEADRIEPMLYPLLRMDLDRQGPRFVVQIGDKAIDYNETFRLYLVTRNPEPHLPPDAASLIAATNFTVTRSGLEGQLLGLTIQHEQPELEHQKSELLKTEEALKVGAAWWAGCLVLFLLFGAKAGVPYGAGGKGQRVPYGAGGKGECVPYGAGGKGERGQEGEQAAHDGGGPR
eukprot:350448-Chlamydomonas_euryale.AAC.4